MSKSVNRVRAALEAAGVTSEILELGQETRTAQMAADVVSCEIDQIAKSIIFQGQDSGNCLLFITAGGQQVNVDRATELAREH